MDWTFDSNQPIYTQLIFNIKFAIVSGELKPGYRMDSVRDLASDAGVNPNTMQRALQELERSGLVFTQRNAGRYVTEDQQLIDSAKHSLAKANVDAFIASMTRLGYTREEILKLLADIEEEEKRDDT